jgi:hypothetical protein
MPAALQETTTGRIKAWEYSAEEKKKNALSRLVLKILLLRLSWAE